MLCAGVGKYSKAARAVQSSIPEKFCEKNWAWIVEMRRKYSLRMSETLAKSFGPKMWFQRSVAVLLPKRMP